MIIEYLKNPVFVAVKASSEPIKWFHSVYLKWLDRLPVCLTQYTVPASTLSACALIPRDLSRWEAIIKLVLQEMPKFLNSNWVIKLSSITCTTPQPKNRATGQQQTHSALNPAGTKLTPAELRYLFRQRFVVKAMIMAFNKAVYLCTY